MCRSDRTKSPVSWLDAAKPSHCLFLDQPSGQGGRYERTLALGEMAAVNGVLCLLDQIGGGPRGSRTIVLECISKVAKWWRQWGGHKGRGRKTKPVCQNDKSESPSSHANTVKRLCHPIVGGTSDKMGTWKEGLHKAKWRW